MDPAFLAMLMEEILRQQTSGNAGVGGDMPYDQFGMGGLGAVDPNSYGTEGELPVIGGMSAVPAMNDTSPSTIGMYRPQQELENRRTLADLLMAMQQGANNGGGQPMQGLFGDPGATITRSSPLPGAPTSAGPVAAPTAGPASPSPSGTPTPKAPDFSFLDKDKAARTLPAQASPRALAAAQRVASVARPNPPMQQYIPQRPTQRPQNPAPKPALATFTAPPPVNVTRSAPRFQAPAFSKGTVRR
jgi:hypothetical protein